MDRNEKAVLQRIKEEEVVEFLRRLIQTPSPFPPGDCREVTEVCTEAFESSGIPHKVVVPDKGISTPFGMEVPEENLPSVIATIEGESPRPVLVYNAHMDTVPIGELDDWDHDPFAAEVVDGKIYGRGAGDDKSSVAAQVMAAKAIVESGIKLQGTLIVNPVADEEACSFRGTKWLREKGYLKPDFLVVGEQTNNQVAIAERGMIWLEMVVHGLACHGAMPWKGENAITKMARIISRIGQDLTPALASKTHPYLPYSTLNVSVISGGVKENVVPERCRAIIDRRIVPGETRETVLAELHEMVKKAAKDIGPISYDLNVLWDGGSPVDTSPDSRLVQTMQEAIYEVSDEERRLTGYQQGSDGRLFAGDGIPIVIFGPSDPAVGHSPNEHVPITQLVEATKVYALTAMRLSGVSSE